MEDTTEVTESESNQGTERTEMNKKPTSGKEIQNESEEKVLEISIYIFPPIIACMISLIQCYQVVMSIVTKKISFLYIY